MRVSRVAGLTLAGLAVSMLVYRNLGGGYSSLSDGTSSGRMTNQRTCSQAARNSYCVSRE